MKKFMMLAALAFGFFSAQAQGLEIGLKVSPSVSNHRFSSPGGYDFKNENVKLRGSIGLVVDYFFGENYAFNTGLEYAVRGGKISYKVAPSLSTAREVDELNIQYLRLPLGVKLYTNEVATDTRLYFLIGTSLNGRISSKIDGDNFYGINNDQIKANKRYNFFEADANLGVGTEWQVGANTKVFGGLAYHRGLVDIDRYYEKVLGNKDIAIRNNSFALDIGIKF